jgi:hypothetical protein
VVEVEHAFKLRPRWLNTPFLQLATILTKSHQLRLNDIQRRPLISLRLEVRSSYALSM